MKKVFMTFVVVLVVSVVVIGCGELVDSSKDDLSKQEQRSDSSTSQEKKSGSMETEDQITKYPSIGISFEELVFGLIYTDDTTVKSKRSRVDPPSIGEIILAPPEYDYKTALSPSMGVSFEEFMYGLIYGGNNTVQAQK